MSLSAAIAGFEAASVLDRMIGGEKIGNYTIPVQASHVVTRQSSDILAIRDPVVAQSVNFIRNSIKEPIQIGDVLESVPVSRRCLYDKFKQILGISVHRYIKKKRIEHIEHLLLDTDMTVSQIAFHMGFTSDDHIATYFRSVNGVNPHAFRVARRAK